MKKIEVVAGVIFWKELVLCVQRPKNKLHYISGKFEFPGGKIEEGETKEEALDRFINFIVETCNGKLLKHEKTGFKEIAIFKTGVTL